MKGIHIYPHPKGWSVRRSGAKRSRRILRNQLEAFAYALDVKEKSGGILYLHDLSGRIRERLE